MNQQLDSTYAIATKAFEGYVVRKDLVRKFKGQYPVPTYVAEFLTCPPFWMTTRATSSAGA